MLIRIKALYLPKIQDIMTIQKVVKLLEVNEIERLTEDTIKVGDIQIWFNEGTAYIQDLEGNELNQCDTIDLLELSDDLSYYNTCDKCEDTGEVDAWDCSRLNSNECCGGCTKKVPCNCESKLIKNI